MLFAAGVVALIVGAEWLVRGAARLAVTMGVSSLVIGLTVVAFGTSAPELAVSLLTARSGQADLALGNVVGSNILNVLLILGASALITSLLVARQLLRLDVPSMILASVAVLLLGADGRIGPADGAVLVACFILYNVILFRQRRKERGSQPAETAPAAGGQPGSTFARSAFDGALIVAGLGLLVLGSCWLVDGAVAIATALGVSELVIGLTLVALGTALPEGATSIAAAVRGERDIAVGNVVGSNIFNILAVLGLSALASGEGVAVSHTALRFDIPRFVLPLTAVLLVGQTWRAVQRRSR